MCNTHCVLQNVLELCVQIVHCTIDIMIIKHRAYVITQQFKVQPTVVIIVKLEHCSYYVAKKK